MPKCRGLGPGDDVMRGKEHPKLYSTVGGATFSEATRVPPLCGSMSPISVFKLDSLNNHTRCDGSLCLACAVSAPHLKGEAKNRDPFPGPRSKADIKNERR